MSLNTLNPEQLKAVRATDGPVLILAGAGSGKTTVLVERIAYMIDTLGIDPYNILAITFTNKAAREMEQRVEDRIGDTASWVWISTFHSLCVRILRRHAENIGYTKDFVIFDSGDSLTAVKEAIRELNIDEKLFSPKSVLHTISSIKDDLLEPEIYLKTVSEYRKVKIGEIYRVYERKLRACNAMDFDDIILNTVKLLSENPDILEHYQRRFRFVMVDEYQDTNNAQYVLISLISGGERNLCVVGDDDQSIYKFRGANIRNILDFEEEHDDALVVKLEQNYRSTQNILSAANSVILHNSGRKDKRLWTDNGYGDKVHCFVTSNEHEEASVIAELIKKSHSDGNLYSDCAVLYRTNAQSRVIEEIFIKEQIPYRVLAGLRFFDRKEIKDITAYLRFVLNPDDDFSLRRIINEPKRGIGDATIARAQAIALDRDSSIYDVLCNAGDYPELSRTEAKIGVFVRMIEEIRERAAEGMSLEDLVALVMTKSGYMDALAAEDTIESKTRIENLNEFISVVKDYSAREAGEAELSGFLENVALVADIDSYDENEDCVVMMTVHSAKGLEFNRVFIPGLDDGLFPSLRMSATEEDIEEERRLCYVAFTRAKKELYLLTASYRMLYGKSESTRPSRFLKEIPDEFKEVTGGERRPRYESAFTRHAPFSAGLSPTQRAAKNTSRTSAVLSAEIDFAPGDRVRHKKFGDGTVIASQRFANDAKVEISFDTCGKKILMAAFAKLKKIK